MSIPTKTQAWILQNRPLNAVNLDFGSLDATFALKTLDLPSSLQQRELLIQVLYFSNDAGQRGWIQKDQDPERFYVPLVEEGDVMRSSAISRVIKTGEGAKAKEGDFVLAYPGWRQYAVVDDAQAQILKPIPGLSLSIFLGALGMVGATAYFALKEVAQLKEGESVLITGAAGATGSLAVQLAKKVFKASRVVGVAGSPEKLEYVKSIGADTAINYNSSTLEKDLVDATPGFVNAVFDGVGGPFLSLAIKRVAKYGHIALIGGTAAYNDHSKDVLYNYLEVIPNRLTIQGLIILDYLPRMGEAISVLSKAVEEGKLTVDGSETIVDISGNFGDVPKVWHKMFENDSSIRGKLITKVAE